MPGMRIKSIRFHHEAFNELRRSPAVLGELERRGDAIAAAAGGSPDFEMKSELTKSRARVVVIAATRAGQLAEAQDRALTRALDAGRS